MQKIKGELLHTGPIFEKIMEKAVKYKLLQKKLYDCLYYFLYSSIKETQLQGLLTRNRLSSNPLRQWCDTLHRTGLDRGKYYNEKPFRAHISAKEYATFLAELYSTWSNMVSKSDLCKTRLPDGQNYKDWLRSGGNEHKYWPVHSLKEKLDKVGNTFFRNGIIHGSICTLDDTDGFSDMDLAFVVKSSVLKDPKKLLQLRQLAGKILTLTYAFDPFMHHGPYYISEMDLKWYPEAMFPLTLFGYGVGLIDSSQELEVGTRASDDVTNQQLDMFEKYFANWPSNPFVLKDSYDLEWVLGSVMLLPALYLQRKTGVFHYKRDTFPLAEKDFSTEEWEPIQIASTLRASLGTRPKPPRPLVWVALCLRWPGLLQRWACRHPLSIQRARKATKTLGQDYTQCVLLLLRMMKSKIENTDTFQRAR